MRKNTESAPCSGIDLNLNESKKAYCCKMSNYGDRKLQLHLNIYLHFTSVFLCSRKSESIMEQR